MSELDATTTTELAGMLRHYSGHKGIQPGLIDAAASRLDRLALLHSMAQVERVPVESEPCAEHPESRCGRCGGPNAPWSTPSPLWNEVMRGGEVSNSDLENWSGIICPTCFMMLAEERGIAELWRLYPQRINRPLQMVTPSRRVWNSDTWLWQKPPCERCGGTGVVPTLQLGGQNSGAISEAACPRCTRLAAGGGHTMTSDREALKAAVLKVILDDAEAPPTPTPYDETFADAIVDEILLVLDESETAAVTS